jgi:hypothetical protein
LRRPSSRTPNDGPALDAAAPPTVHPRLASSPIGPALARRGIFLPAELKAPLAVGGGVTASYALARLIITRIPGMSHIL